MSSGGGVVSLCVHLFFACSVFSDPLKLTFSSGKVALVNKPVFLRSTYRSEHSEAQASFLTFRLCLNRAFFFDDRVINASCSFLLKRLLPILVCQCSPWGCGKQCSCGRQ